MWARQLSNSLLKRVQRRCQLAAAVYRQTGDGSTCQKVRLTSASQFCFKHNHESGSILQMLLFGQAALFVGGGFSNVYAEERSGGTTSTNVAEGSNDIILQQVEDGSVISNEHTSKWRIFTDNGREFFLKGKLTEAEKFFTSAVAEAKMGFGERDPHVASAFNNLAELYRVRKFYDKAEPLYLDSISILEETFGPEDVRVGAALHNLGQFYIMQQKLEKARACYERALKIKGRVLGQGHPDYSETMFHLGTVLYLQGHVNDAEVLIQDSIRILEEGSQGESYSCIRKLRYLAKIYLKLNDRLEEAENVQRKILQIIELTKGWNSLDTVNAAESLSVTLQLRGKLREAQELLESCLNVRRSLLPKDHLQIGANMLGLANVALLNFEQLKKTAMSEALKELDRAEEFSKDSVRIAEKCLYAIKHERKNQNKRYIGKDGHAALVILLKSLKALANVEKAKHGIQDTKKALPLLEAEKPLRRCISAFKEYIDIASNSASVELKAEYVSCMKTLFDLTANTHEKHEKSKTKEVEDLKNEIRSVEADM